MRFIKKTLVRRLYSEKDPKSELNADDLVKCKMGTKYVAITRYTSFNPLCSIFACIIICIFYTLCKHCFIFPVQLFNPSEMLEYCVNNLNLESKVIDSERPFLIGVFLTSMPS